MTLSSDLTENNDKPLVAFELFNRIPNGLLVLRPVGSNPIIDFTCVYINEKARELFAPYGQFMDGHSLIALFPAELSTFLLQPCMQVFETDSPFEAKAFPLKSSDTETWTNIHVQRIDESLLLTFCDVTETHLSQQASRRILHSYEETLHASPNSIIAMKPIRQGQIIVDFLMETANDGVKRDLFKHPDDIAGKRMLHVFPGNIESGLFNIYVRVAESRKPEHAVQYYKDLNGLEAWFDVTAYPKGTEDVVLTFTNVTATQLDIKQLQHSNESLEQFASSASHDLQEPLRKIRYFGQLLYTKYAEQMGDGVEVLNKMLSSTERMSNLIEDLLMFSQITSSPVVLEPTDLNEILSDVLTDLEVPISHQHAQVTIGHLPGVLGNATQLRQLFQNLLSNALKYVAPGVEPRISIHARPYASTSDQNYWAIDIADNGIGIAEEYREKIFQAFLRLHSRNQYAGTGLGLAIVKQIIENHEGFISLQSNENQGTTFTVVLKSASLLPHS